METIIHYLYELIDKSGAVDENGNVNESQTVSLGNGSEVTVKEIYKTISVLEESQD